MKKRGKFGKFIACTNYPDCKATFKLPASGLAKALDKTCETCKHPMITVIRAGKRPQEVCINPDCPSKVSPEAKQKIAESENTKCAKCGEGVMVVRRSVYGSFLGCNKFPKCRNIIKLNN